VTYQEGGEAMKKITKIEGNQDYIFKPKTRVVAYCRVSTDSDEQLVSLQAQKALMRPTLRQIQNGNMQAYTMTRVSVVRKRRIALAYLECYQTVKPEAST